MAHKRHLKTNLKYETMRLNYNYRHPIYTVSSTIFTTRNTPRTVIPTGCWWRHISVQHGPTDTTQQHYSRLVLVDVKALYKLDGWDNGIYVSVYDVYCMFWILDVAVYVYLIPYNAKANVVQLVRVWCYWNWIQVWDDTLFGVNRFALKRSDVVYAQTCAHTHK